MADKDTAKKKSSAKETDAEANEKSKRNKAMRSEFTEHFSNAVRESRLEKGYTQEQVSEELGYSLYTIQEIEKGRLGVSIHRLRAFCEYFKKDPNDFFPASYRCAARDERGQNIEFVMQAMKRMSKDDMAKFMEFTKLYYGDK